MKIKIEFNTEDENFDYYESRIFLNARHIANALSDIKEKIRYWYKDDKRLQIPDDEIKEEIEQIIQENNVGFIE